MSTGKLINLVALVLLHWCIVKASSAVVANMIQALF